MLTNEEKINLRERALRLSMEMDGPLVFVDAESIYQFISKDLDDDPLRPDAPSPDFNVTTKASVKEIDWSRPQLVIGWKEYNKGMVVSVTGDSSPGMFSGVLIDGKDKWVISGIEQVYTKLHYEYYGEIPEETTLPVVPSTRRVFIYPNGEESNTVYVSRLDRPELYDAYDNGKKCSWYIEDYIKTLDVKPVLLPRFVLDCETPPTIQEPKTTGLNFLEAVIACKAGRNITRKAWLPTNYFIYYSSGGLYYQDGEECKLSNSCDLLATDWQIVNH